MNKKLYRTEGKDAKILGVCGGVSEYFNIDPTLVRLVWALLSLFYGAGILVYFIMAIILPVKSESLAGDNNKEKEKSESSPKETTKDDAGKKEPVKKSQVSKNKKTTK